MSKSMICESPPFIGEEYYAQGTAQADRPPDVIDFLTPTRYNGIDRIPPSLSLRRNRYVLY